MTQIAGIMVIQFDFLMFCTSLKLGHSFHLSLRGCAICSKTEGIMADDRKVCRRALLMVPRCAQTSANARWYAAYLACSETTLMGGIFAVIWPS